MIATMTEVTLTAENGRTLMLRRLTSPDDESIWTYEATLAIPGGAVATVIYDHGPWLAGYFREVADAWQGFDDTKSFSSLEGQLTMDARHDGLGTVYCAVRLGQPWPPEWHVSAVLDLGAGAHLEHLADEIEGFLG